MSLGVRHITVRQPQSTLSRLSTKPYN